MAKQSFKLKRKLSRTFQFFFLLAISIPVLSVLRVSYDSLQQKISLNQREVASSHEQIGARIDEIFRSYEQTNKNLIRKFYEHKVFRKFPGSRDSRVWANRDKDFLDDASSEEKGRILRAYLKHRNAYRETIWEAYSNDTTTFDEWKSPVKSQVHVWEQMLFDPKYKERKDYSKERFKVKKWSYQDLQPEKWSGRGLSPEEIAKLAGIERFEKIWPIHPVFLAANQQILSQLWDQLGQLFKDILKLNTLGQEGLSTDNDIKKFENVTGADFMDMRGRFTVLKFPGLEMELFWDVYPTNFDFEKYRKGKGKPPVAVFSSLYDRPRAEQFFMELLLGSVRTPYFKQISGEIDSLRDQVFVQKMGWSLLDLKQLDRKGGEPLDMRMDESGQFSRVKPDEQTAEFNKLNSWEMSELIGILDEMTGKFRKHGETLNNYFRSNLNFGEDTILKKNLETGLHLMGKLGKPLFFSYERKLEDGTVEPMLGTIYPSSTLEGKAFFIRESQREFLASVRNNILGIVSVVLFVIFLVLMAGRFLSRSIVEPILSLSAGMDRFAQGRYDETFKIDREDEIGRLGREFNSMAHKIQEKLFEMRSVGIVNLLMNHDLPRRVMLKYILHLLCIKYGAGFGLIGFFENGLSSSIQDYPQWGSENMSEEQKDALIKNLVNEFYPQTSRLRLVKPEEMESLGLPFENAVSFYTCPEESGEEQSEIQVYGMLLLANVSEALFQSLLELETRQQSLEKHAVVSLCDQAKTVVLKTLLDEIEGDTKKGQEIQESLMPSKPPESDGCLDIGSFFRGARGLAGDYFDFMKSPDGRYVGASIADVSGKGIGPSLFGATSRACMKILTQQYPTQTGQVLEELNNQLCYKKTSSLFLTMFHCVIDLETLNLYYGSAGHNKMFLIKEDGELIHLNAKGVPAGLFSPMVYEAKEMQLEVGDSVILYTDGVTELENAKQELYGMEKFEEFCVENRSLSAEEWIETLDAELEEFRKGIFPSDDITYIILKVIKSKAPVEEVA